jgi:hypothetical protein
MTPSGWYDDAYRSRSVGHDEMQLAVWRHLKAHPRETFHHKGRIFTRRSITLECAFAQKGVIKTFADICETYEESSKNGIFEPATCFVIYEIKPVIASVGAIIRQCTAQRHLIEYNPANEERWPDGKFYAKDECRVIPVVPHDDKNVGLLREMFGATVLTWDGERLAAK